MRQGIRFGRLPQSPDHERVSAVYIGEHRHPEPATRNQPVRASRSILDMDIQAFIPTFSTQIRTHSKQATCNAPPPATQLNCAGWLARAVSFKSTLLANAGAAHTAISLISRGSSRSRAANVFWTSRS